MRSSDKGGASEKSIVPLFLSSYLLEAELEAPLASRNCLLYSCNVPQRKTCGFLDLSSLQKSTLFNNKRNRSGPKAKETCILKVTLTSSFQPPFWMLLVHCQSSHALVLGALLHVNMKRHSARVASSGWGSRPRLLFLHVLIIKELNFLHLC